MNKDFIKNFSYRVALSCPYIGARGTAPKLTFKATEWQGDGLALVLEARGGMVLTYHPFKTLGTKWRGFIRG